MDKNHDKTSQVDSQKQINPNEKALFFEIQVRGQLDSRWSAWLEGLEVKLLENGEMKLCGSIKDQAALMGVLNKLNRLNLTLISVNEVNQKKKGEEYE